MGDRHKRLVLPISLYVNMQTTKEVEKTIDVVGL